MGRCAMRGLCSVIGVSEPLTPSGVTAAITAGFLAEDRFDFTAGLGVAESISSTKIAGTSATTAGTTGNVVPPNALTIESAGSTVAAAFLERGALLETAGFSDAGAPDFFITIIRTGAFRPATRKSHLPG